MDHWYNGAPMRSTCETTFARWCDSQGLKWAYEPAKFADGIGHWCPDFHLRHVPVSWSPRPLDVFVEVKFGKWLIELEPAKRKLVLSNYAALYATRPDAVVIVEQSGIVNRPAIVDLIDGVPTLSRGKWVKAANGAPMLARDFGEPPWSVNWWNTVTPQRPTPAMAVAA